MNPNPLNSSNPFGAGTCFAVTTGTATAVATNLLSSGALQFTGPANVYVGTSAANVVGMISQVTPTYTVLPNITTTLIFVPNVTLTPISPYAYYLACVTATATSSSSSSSSRVGLIVVLILLVLIVVVVAGFYGNRYYQKRKAQKEEPGVTNVAATKRW